MPFNKAAFSAALLAGISMPAVALAATSAVTRADLNLRTGPSSNYARISTIPEGDRVVVYGCTSGYSWCDVSWDDNRGWVYSDYLAYYGGDGYVRWDRYAPRIDFPIISFSFGDYHDRYYRNRPWYRIRDYRDYDRDRDRNVRLRYRYRDDDYDRRTRDDRDYDNDRRNRDGADVELRYRYREDDLSDRSGSGSISGSATEAEQRYRYRDDDLGDREYRGESRQRGGPRDVEQRYRYREDDLSRRTPDRYPSRD